MKPKIVLPQKETKTHKLRIIGICLIIYVVLGFVINFHVVDFLIKFSFTGDFAAFWNVFWNPPSYFTGQIVDGIWIVGGGIGMILNYVFALIWALGIGVLGVVLAK